MYMHAYACMHAQAPVSTSPVSGGQYGQSFSGDGTYYGETDGGHCSYGASPPGMYSGMIPGTYVSNTEGLVVPYYFQVCG